MDAKEYLHEILHEDDSVFDSGGKQEYTEEQLIRFAELWAAAGYLADPYDGKTRTGGLSPDTGPRS
jgi:hypothetical protein|tara:strand:+ start:195 stop:392 length:198 start_codon:yes stop_codon:yes gene_type:complete